MSKFFNNAIIGNSKILGCLTDKGELIRLYYPNIDYFQNIDRYRMGIAKEGRILWPSRILFVWFASTLYRQCFYNRKSYHSSYSHQPKSLRLIPDSQPYHREWLLVGQSLRPASVKEKNNSRIQKFHLHTSAILCNKEAFVDKGSFLAHH